MTQKQFGKRSSGLRGIESNFLIFIPSTHGRSTVNRLLMLRFVDGLCSYLVCSTYEEALEIASSVSKRISRMKTGCENDMLEAAGMVLVQSLKELGR